MRVASGISFRNEPNIMEGYVSFSCSLLNTDYSNKSTHIAFINIIIMILYDNMPKMKH
jgi:hypothetical protein